MPDIAISPEAKMIIAGIAGLWLLVTVIVSNWSKIKSLFPSDHLAPSPNPRSSSPAQSDIDEAIRLLVSDSRERKCHKSISLLNEWICIRNLREIEEAPSA